MRKYAYGLALTFGFILLALMLSTIPSSSNSDRLTGNAIAQVLVLNFENGTCLVPLNKGWNLASFICAQEDNRMVAYFANITNSITSIHTYDAFESLNKWKAYNPNLPSWVVQSLTDVNMAEGYWIRMSDPEVFRNNGSISKPTQIPLKKGWNLAGYPTDKQKNISDSLFRNMGTDFSYVYMYNSSDIVSPWKVFLQNAPAFVTLDMDNFTTGYGYWINASKTGEWYVNY